MRPDKYSITLDGHMKILIENIKSLNTKFTSVILDGGYGRDEGSWIIENDGTVRPYNDYDIVLVLRDKISQKQINHLRKEVAQILGIQWVDIDQYSPEELQYLRPSIYSYDLKYASKVIAGDEAVLNRIPDMNSSELSLIDGEILFFTRLWTLLGSFGVSGLKTVKTGEESRFFRNQMAKAILAVVDVLLLQKKAYHPSYKERIKRLYNHYHEKNNLCQLSQWALEEKLLPQAPLMTAQEVQTLYAKVHSYFFCEMYRVLTKYYLHPIDSVPDIESYLCYSLSDVLKKFCEELIKGKLLSKRSEFFTYTKRSWNDSIVMNRLFEKDHLLAIKLAQAYVAAAYESGGINKYLLQKGIKWMKCIDKTIPLNLTWDNARVKVARMRMEVH